jgi:hypothetical protein
VQLGEQVRTAEQAQMIALAHERWARSGERCGGLIYKAIRWSTTSTSYVQIGTGSDWPLSRWCPAVRFTVEQEGGVVRVSWQAFVRNLQLQIAPLDIAYSPILLSSASATSNAWQWIGNSFNPAISVPDTVVLRVSARRLAFASDGDLRHFSAVARPTAATQIPGQP